MKTITEQQIKDILDTDCFWSFEIRESYEDSNNYEICLPHGYELSIEEIFELNDLFETIDWIICPDIDKCYYDDSPYAKRRLLLTISKEWIEIK